MKTSYVSAFFANRLDIVTFSPKSWWTVSLCIPSIRKKSLDTFFLLPEFTEGGEKTTELFWSLFWSRVGVRVLSALLHRREGQRLGEAQRSPPSRCRVTGYLGTLLAQEASSPSTAHRQLHAGGTPPRACHCRPLPASSALPGGSHSWDWALHRQPRTGNTAKLWQ